MLRAFVRRGEEKNTSRGSPYLEKECSPPPWAAEGKAAAL